MSAYVMRRARPAELNTVMQLLSARISWLHSIGSNQWSTRDFLPIMKQAVASGETWLMSHQGEPVATLTMTTIGDRDFWTPAELQQPALYISKVATHPEVKGHGIGALLLDWANAYAQSWGVSMLRWDVWRDNEQLHAYYHDLGFQPIRTVEVPGRYSGVLYQLAYVAPHQLTGTISTEAEMTAVTLESEIVHLADHGEPSDPFLYETPQPDHLHRVTGLWVPLLGSPEPEPPRELLIPSHDNTRIVLFNSGQGWHAKASFTHAITEWNNEPNLKDGRLYAITHQTDADGCRVVLLGEQLADPAYDPQA